jgi:hypothetical protein
VLRHAVKKPTISEISASLSSKRQSLPDRRFARAGFARISSSAAMKKW